MKTAVHELIEDLINGNVKPDGYYLEKEKQQIIDAYVAGFEDVDAEQYFKETYNTKQQ
jgi:phosphoenolpyruvate synthase/pyruvate phosphate dikinase